MLDKNCNPDHHQSLYLILTLPKLDKQHSLQNSYASCDIIYYMEQFDLIASDFTNYISLINSIDHWVFLKNMSQGCGRLLDIGCGSGLLTSKFVPHFSETIGIDISSEMIEIAKKQYLKTKFMVMDGNTLEFPDEYFDMVVSQHTFHHLQREKAVNEVKRVLKKNGVAVIMDPVNLRDGLRKSLMKIIYRNVYSKVKLELLYGKKVADKCWECSEGPIWREHREEDKKVELSVDESRKLYSELMPGSKFFLTNYKVYTMVWKKN